MRDIKVSIKIKKEIYDRVATL